MGDRASSSNLRCIERDCGCRFAIDRRLYSCPQCGGLLDVEYSFHFAESPERFKALFNDRRRSDAELDRSGVWRFRELLPFVTDNAKIITLGEGNTPIYEGPRSANYAGVRSLTFKHQGLNPTGSFKDNGMTTGISQAAILGARAVACASTGNTSASMAAYAARANMRAFVFIPSAQVAYGKLSQALEYGASVMEIEGNFDDALRIVRELADEADLYLLNSVNPFRLEGQKAIVVEMIEQLGWRPPNWIILPGGNLGNTAAFGKSLRELFDNGFIDRMPRLGVIQAEGAAPFYNLFKAGYDTELAPVTNPSTRATAIRIGNPVSWKKALRSLSWTGGLVERVSENEIANAKAVIGRDGIGCEPASAATLAGLKKLVAAGKIDADETVICLLTGNLLKDPDYTVQYHTEKMTDLSGAFVNRPLRVPAVKEEIKKHLGL